MDVQLPPAQITICGALGRDTVTALVEFAMRAGAALLVQPRPTGPAGVPRELTGEVAVVEAPARTRRAAARRASPRPSALRSRATGRRQTKAVALPPVVAQPADRKSPDRQAAQQRRWVVLQALERAGEAGLSFTALFQKVKAHLADAGDSEQQFSALRNSLQILKGHGFVERAVGQWILASDGKQRMQLGRDGGPL